MLNPERNLYALLHRILLLKLELPEPISPVVIQHGMRATAPTEKCYLRERSQNKSSAPHTMADASA